MSAPILATKLFVPPPRAKVVLRPRLIERMNEGVQRKLTLISAPAGFGKTSLVSEWAAGAERPVAWLSLDDGENDPARFLAYLAAALQTVAAYIGEGVLSGLQSPQPTSTESILTALLNEIAAVPHNIVLVLDDYHVIEARAVDTALTFLLEHLPPNMHLVLATREDPNLPLARYRARDQLTELRAADLRFTLSEAAGFLNQVMGLQLSAENIAALETRTEGWIAGLQLAALALQGTISRQGHPDAEGFITSFTGGHHFVMDYLVEEVLHQQPESVQTFLLRTSILGRLCGPLCDAVCSSATDGRPSATSGQETLESLERANLLVFPLDDQRNWYRYHHLFADVLQARLMKEQPGQVTGLHLRACAWFEQNNFRADAIHHALAAGDFERAADLIEMERSVNRGAYLRSATWLGWVKALPEEVVRSRPRLSAGYAWELLFMGEMEAAENRMRDGERSLEVTRVKKKPAGAPSTGKVVVDEDELRLTRASIAIARAFHAQALGDVAGTVKHARRALTIIAETDYHPRGLASALMGMACLTNGDLETAFKYMTDGMASLRMAGSLLFATSGTYVLANIRIAQGRLLDAARIYTEALQLVTAQGEPAIQGIVDLYLGLGGLHLEWGDLEAARQYLARSEELGERAALPDWPYQLYLAQAQIKKAYGDLDGVIELLDKAEQIHHRNPIPDVHPIAAMKARVWIGQGRLAEALGWVHGRNLSIDDELSYLHEFEYVTLARVLIACYQSGQVERPMGEVAGLLERLLTAAEEGGRTGSVIEILLLQAMVYQAMGNLPQALAPLGRALTLAEPEGYVRIFIDEGLAMEELLAGVIAAHESGRPEISDAVKRHVHRLLAAFGRLEKDHPSAIRYPTLMEPLSQREKEVLQLISQGLSNREISEKLFLALDTVKGHNREIFDKLRVQRRTEAVARARELGLL